MDRLQALKNLAEALGVDIQRGGEWPGCYYGKGVLRWGERMARATIFLNPTLIKYGNLNTEDVLAHELAHHLGYDFRAYRYTRCEQELFAEGAVAYAMGWKREHEKYLDEVAELFAPTSRPVNWGRLRGMVAIVGEHLRAAIESEADHG